MLPGVLIFLALGVAAVYFTIAAFVVPKIALPGASPRFVNVFRLGAVAFFIGCGLSHLHIAVHAFTESEDVRLHELGFHVLQFVGGAFFVWAAFRFLEIEVQVKKSKDDERLDQLKELALRDPLTGAYNRRFFDEEMARALARFRRDEEPFAIAQVDIDDFKSVNDEHGHGVGDEVLKALVVSMNELIRPTDTLMRFGGDEFGLILPGADAETALRITERVRATVESASGSRTPRITVSAGIAACPEHGTLLDDLLDQSDVALYESKREGKNRSLVATPAQARI